MSPCGISGGGSSTHSWRWASSRSLANFCDIEDARLAADQGADALIVSNHGGRQLDGAPSTIEALPAIVAEVGSRIEVWMDGGIRSGQDVLKAVALGARGTLIGRPFLYGLGAMGEAGVTTALEIIARELDLTMAICGHTDIRDGRPQDSAAGHISDKLTRDLRRHRMLSFALGNREPDMTLIQLMYLKRWHVEHRGDHPVEYHVWDMMLTAWVMGWVGMPAASDPVGAARRRRLPRVLRGAALYVRLRERLHRQGRRALRLARSAGRMPARAQGAVALSRCRV